MSAKKSLLFLIVAIGCLSVHASPNSASTDYVAAKIAILQAEIIAILDSKG